MRVLIAGMSEVGRQLLTALTQERGYEVAVVDLDERLCEELAAGSDALVINGDATDPETLAKAQIDEADAVVACTNSDPINTVVAMLAHRQQVEQIIVVVTTDAMRGALQEIGVTDIIAPTMAAVAEIEAGLLGAEHTHLSELMEGGLRLAEMRVGAEADGTRLGDHRLPEGTLAVAHVRDERMRLARDDTELREGDAVLVLADSEKTARSARSAME